MGKIKVRDLARMMNLPEQDLMFKLRSIGVRLDGEDTGVDSEVIQAILQGKRLPQPREVILRDDSGAEPPPREAAPQPTRGARGPLRPTRRTMIQRVEPRIRELDVKRPETAPAEAPATPAKPPAEQPAASSAPAAEQPAAPTKPAKKIKPSPERSTKRPAAARPSRPAASRPSKPRPVAPRPTPRPPSGRRPPPRRPPMGPPRPRPRRIERMDDRRMPARLISRPEPEKPAMQPQSARGHRRAARRQDPEQASAVVQFKGERPEGPVTITAGMTVRDFAEKLGVKSKDLIKALFSRGIMANINHVIDGDLAAEVAADLGVETMEVSIEEEVQLQHEIELDDDIEKTPRAPVVTVMGHVDHGKTTLLDSIREADVAAGEAGGITQHIGAYEVEAKGRKVVFLDTPGHEAFTMMRARGASATDVVVLVVAADDGVMPQTKEAIDHARAAEVPIIVAINKIDKANANPDRVKKDLADYELLVEDWGGDIVSIPVSALKGEGIAELLEMLALTADLLELRAAPDLPAQGVVLEARKEIGRGIVATVLVQDGTLKKGDVFVAGQSWGKVRSMVDSHGKRVKEAPPATPVEVTGFDEPPSAGDLFQVFTDESKARSTAEYRRHENRQRELAPQQGRLSLEQLFDQMGADEVKELPVIVKADVQGSVEVLREALEKLSTDKVKLQVIHAAVGAISTNNVLLASASNAIVLGFNVRPERNAQVLAEKEGVEIRLHTVIYELLDEITLAMTGLLEPVFREVHTGTAEVRQTFKVPKFGVIAGSHVTDGVVRRGGSARLLRDNTVVYEGKIASLRRFKDDATEVRTGFDCGIGLENFQDYKPGDQIEIYDREEVRPEL